MLQGGVLSPFFFAVFIDSVVEKIKSLNILNGVNFLKITINFQALGNHFSTEGQGQKLSFIMLDDTLIFTPPLEIVLTANAVQ